MNITGKNSFAEQRAFPLQKDLPFSVIRENSRTKYVFWEKVMEKTETGINLILLQINLQHMSILTFYTSK